MLDVSKKDLIQLENLMKILKRAKLEITGDEILSMAQAITWLSTRYADIETILHTNERKEHDKPTAGDSTELEKEPKIIRRRKK